ncbi:hypothetical protein F4801DRAFT_599502 [Xylaria longipes]|nr:hypothetical protein F4801DRAFT_599502 [Xylaria longipes]
MRSKDIARRYLPLKWPGEAMYASEYYDECFERGEEMQRKIPKTNIPGSDKEYAMEPWIVEAPLNSVEVLEALLKPAQSLQIYTAQHIPRTPVTASVAPLQIQIYRQIYREFVRFQGR